MPDTPVGYLLWWPRTKKYYLYCTICASGPRRERWTTARGPSWPIYKELVGNYSQRCHDCGRITFMGEDFLFPDEFLIGLPGPEAINA